MEEFNACKKIVCRKAGVHVTAPNLYLCRKLYRVIRKQPLYYDIEVNNKKYIITHSWLVDNDGHNCISYPEQANIDLSIYDRAKTVVGWLSDDEVTVIHGHTPTVARDCVVRGAVPGKVWVKDGNVNIDCGSALTLFNGGNLGAYCIETGESVYALTE